MTALKEKETATAVLRRRLKAGLRPDLSSDGLHQIEMMQCHGEEMRPASGARKSKDGNSKEVIRMPSMGIRKMTSQWDHANPFEVSNTTTLRDPKAARIADKDTPGDDHEVDTDCYVRVALASASASNDPYPAHLRPGGTSAPIPAVDLSVCLPGHSVDTSPQTLCSAGASPGQSPDDDGANSLSMVVARAECELAHPRPSRSSESRMLKVLVKGRESNAGQGEESSSPTWRQSCTS